MSRIEDIFADMRADGRKALMPFLCAGYPPGGSLSDSLKAVQDAGAPVAEVGIPFSDPIADGPVIAAAMHEALEHGVTTDGVLEEISAVRDELTVGLVAMVSVSIVQRRGAERFVGAAAEAGFDGFIIPDLPVEESDEFARLARKAGTTSSLLIAPTTPRDRAAAIASACTGFVYLLARTGITGERSEVPEVAERVGLLRGVTDLPIACGFGISTPEHVRAVVQHADAAIVGSALVRRMGDASSRGADPAVEAGEFIRSLSGGLSG